jgi:hypothetical protein
MSLQARLLIAMIAILFSAIVLMGGIYVNIAVSESKNALAHSVKERLTSPDVQSGQALHTTIQR